MRLSPLLAAPLAVFGAALSAAAPSPAQAPGRPALALPIACRVGVDCEVQNYVDADPGPGAKDFTCAGRTYEKHNGVDFRLPDFARQRQGVAVLAAADGRVLRLRDGVTDVSVKVVGLASVEGTNCGNGVVIGHPGGWETQYCHMAKGSLTVKVGDAVKSGQPIGKVGLSGQTEYPHLHFTVREGTTVVDPFAYGAPAGACNAGTSLWRPEVKAVLAYKPRVVLNTGFAAEALTMDKVESGTLAAPNAAAPAVLAYARAIGLKAGDVQTLTLKAPDGSVLRTNKAAPLPRDQAQNFIFTGVQKPAGGWAKGRYAGEYVVQSGGRTVLQRRFELGL